MKDFPQFINSVARLVTLSLCYFVTLNTWAQPVEGTSYYLPKTAVRITLTVEKKAYTPGELASYAQRYMKLNNVEQQPSTQYRLIGIDVTPFAVPDTAKHYTLTIDRRYSLNDVRRSDSGILLAINTNPAPEPKLPALQLPKEKQHKVLNPKDYMNEDILTAGSTAKMAQLIAQEIYDIRDSRNQLQRGQADFMPKDGQQLQIMMQGLDTQERALRQVFEGVTLLDTLQQTFDFTPEEAVSRQLLFRFSRYFGLVDTDDLSGVPYYITVEAPAPPAPDDTKKKEKMKDDIGLVVNKPVKAVLTLFCEQQPVKKFDFFAPQFGATESLSGVLFGKKITSKVVLNPVTGGLESIREEQLEK